MQPYPPVVSGVAFVPPQAPVIRELPFKFTGNAKEYFRIWIVNTLLTIVTLGVYSAWAKVRTKQYFYRNTSVDGTSFDYLANPIQVLKGRIIAALALGLLFASQKYSLTLYFVVLGIFVLATPWVLVMALGFNARNSSYRGIRLAFTGRVGEAAGLYVGMLLFNVITCGLAFPYVEWRMTSFAITRHLYGDLRFTWTTKAGGYYRAYLLALVLTIPGYVLLLIAMFAARDGEGPAAMQAAMVPAMIVFYAYLLIPGAFLRAQLQNLVYGGMRIGEHELASNQRGFELFKLYAVNLLAIVFSLGLLIPWAKIRLAAYRASCLTLVASGPLLVENLLDGEGSALGEGMSDLGDFDIGIGA